MKTEVEKIIERFLNYDGEHSYIEFAKFHSEVHHEKDKEKTGSRNFVCLKFIADKLMTGMQHCIRAGGTIRVEIVDTLKDIENGYKHVKAAIKKHAPAKKRKAPKKKKSHDLGKLVDSGQEIPGSKSDEYWGDDMDIVFGPNDEHVRIGDDIPSEYKYSNIRYIESYYGLKGIEFGNWLSQQDRVNYLSGFGMALYDLHKVLGFTPKQIGLKGKLAVAFGARGQGRSVAHFDEVTFVINLNRYSRPEKVADRPKKFKRVNLIVKNGNGGGVGAFAHEFAHALDFYSGSFIEKAISWQISGGDKQDPAMPKESGKKLQGLMNTLMNKIMWKSKKIHSAYYTRLKKTGAGEYDLQRNEIWARSFEVFVQYQLENKKHKNIFLNEPKYSEKLYLTFSEMKKLEPDYHALLNEIKKHL